MKRLWQVFDWLDGIEFMLCAAAAAVLLIGGPVYLVLRFLASHHYLAASALGLLWCMCVVACVRDCRRKRFTWITGSLFVVWLVATLWVGMSSK